MNQRQLFLNHIAQTSDIPLALEPVSAKGIYITDAQGKVYFDLISGISVSNLGHSHPKIVEAVKQQAEKYMHLMVYGEFIKAPQVQLAKLLTQQLPKNLEAVYFTNSGTEATEGALKLAKRYTGRTEIIHFKYSYHGSTAGSLSVIGDESFKSNYRPLPPDTRMLEYGNFEDLEKISCRTAAVILDPVQAESGITVPPKGYLKALEEKCKETKSLFILDEIQTGAGRTGSLFRLQAENLKPDILLLAKGFGGGMPIGAFISSREKFEVFHNNPILGHITTFGGHPVSCAAALASLEILLETDIISKVEAKGQLFEDLLKHKAIIKTTRAGLMMAIHFESFEFNKKVIDYCIEDGLITDWFLFASNCLRIGPPLIIEESEIKKACAIILKNIDRVIEES